jgi:hypothetical protein
LPASRNVITHNAAADAIIMTVRDNSMDEITSQRNITVNFDGVDETKPLALQSTAEDKENREYNQASDDATVITSNKVNMSFRQSRASQVMSIHDLTCPVTAILKLAQSLPLIHIAHKYYHSLHHVEVDR